MKIKKFYCILIPELTKKYWLFIFFLIGSLFRKMLPSLLSDYAFEINKKNIEFKEERREIYFDIVCNVLSDLLTGILHCIAEKNRLKHKRNNNSINTNKERISTDKKDLQIKFIFNEEQTHKAYLFKMIFIISLIDFTCQLLFFGNCIIRKYDYFNDSKKDNVLRNPEHLYSFLVIDIVSRYIFSSLILKTYFYSHHYLSFFLNFIGLSILLIVDIKFKIGEYNLIYKIMIILQYILYSLEDIINKVALINLFINPETLLFYKGLFSLAYLSILTLSLFIFDKINLPTLNGTFFANIFCRLYFVIFNIIRSVYLVKVIDFFSSQHISFLRVLETILLFFFYKIDSSHKKEELDKHPDINLFDNYFHLPALYDLIEIGAFLILLFSALIHNEIIILKCKRYKMHTIYFLNIEADKEQIDILFDEENGNDIYNNDSSFDNTQTLSSVGEVNNTYSF